MSCFEVVERGKGIGVVKVCFMDRNAFHSAMSDMYTYTTRCRLSVVPSFVLTDNFVGE